MEQETPQVSQVEENLNQTRLQTEQMQQVQYLEEQNVGTAKEQLDLEQEKQNISFLLRGYIKIVNDKGEKVWVAPKDDEMVILTDYGIHLILNAIEWYLNKNTLLSNYDDETILRKMEDVSNSINDVIYMKYDKVFKYPSFEDCKKVLDSRIKGKMDIRIFSMELLGKKVSDEEKKEIENKILKEFEPMLEKEFEKIKQQLMKDKLKRFELLIREIQDAIHSTYNRAWKGEERKTLRQHHHITETKAAPPQQREGISSGWFKRR